LIDLKSLAVNEFVTPPTKNKVGYFVVDPFIGTTFLTLKLYNESNENILIYCSSNFEVNETYNALSSFINKDDLITLPSEELLRVEYLSESKDLLAQQIYGLYSIINAKHKIIILSPSSLYRFYPSKETFLSNSLKLEVNKEYNFNEIKKRLMEAGYTKVSKIDQSLEYAIRGDIIDVFSLNYENPIRIEFFDDLVESIREFNIATQTSFKELSSIDILPASLNLLTEEERASAKDKINDRLSDDKQYLSNVTYEELKAQIEEDLEAISTNNLSSKFYKYIGFLQKKHTNLLEFIDNYKIIVNNEDEFFKARDFLFEEANSFLFDLNKNGKSISGLAYFNHDINIFKDANYQYFLNNFYIHENSVSIAISTNSLYSTRDIDLTRVIEIYIKSNYKILALVENKEQVEKLENTIKTLNLTYALSDGFNLDEKRDITISVNSFSHGFEYKSKNYVVLSTKELFGFRRNASTYTSKFREGIVLESYQDLVPGDYVVHEKSGIGRFVKISTLEIDNKHEDYLQIQYDGGDVLYVPLYQFNLVRKYVGKDGYAPKLNRLYSTKWETTKAKIKARINDLAERLMALYSERAQIKGFEYKPEKELEDAFAREFDYELTKDQESSLKDIYKDMESTHPMDRLLCGDVGFGKTEVAFRAAFRAILNGKMVILLCPTTLLCRQHYEVALKRFNKFDVRIAMYSRMQSSEESKHIEEEVKAGKIHLLIGTHKALSKKLDTTNLGLLIVDEEQRFGVEQKERIKERSKGIDVLTLSATPIPRTLQSSLVGLKQVSTIETPPKERVAIQTYVIPYDRNVVRELIKRELSRHGQIFYVHNKIETIYEKCEELQKLVPDCKIGIVHGKMDKEETNEVMQDFYDGKIDLLLATSIIENGIDVENANLMLIEHANAFGLAQLYQIKGRVGRGDRMAFAYLMVDKTREINEAGQKRLEAIQDLTALGSGYKIAQRDLLIRGAGDILGPEQAGFIDAVGIDMYIKLLNETIEEKKTGIKKAQEIKIHKELGIDAYIPSIYIPNEEKVENYHKILNTKNFIELDEAEKSVRDIYGPIPENMELLFKKRRMDLYLEKEDFKDLNEFDDHVVLILSTAFSDIEGIGTSLFTALIPYLKKIKMSFVNKEVCINIKKEENWVELLLKVSEIVDNLYNERKKALELNEN